MQTVDVPFARNKLHLANPTFFKLKIQCESKIKKLYALSKHLFIYLLIYCCRIVTKLEFI